MGLTLSKEKCVGQTKSHRTPTMNVHMITNFLLNNTNMKAAQIKILVMQLKMTCKNSLTGKFLEQSVMMTGIIVSNYFTQFFKQHMLSKIFLLQCINQNINICLSNVIWVPPCLQPII